MELNNLPNAIQNDFNDITEQFLNKKIHLVCIADNVYDFYFHHAFKLKNNLLDLVQGQIDRVNRMNETGTFFPDYYMTIMPLSKYNGRDSLGDRNSMVKNIRDCFEANEKYIKSSKLVFALERRPDFDIDLAHEVLEAEAMNTNFTFTKEIVFSEM